MEQTAITTLEGNKLIAEFMGLKPFEDSRYGLLFTNPNPASKSSVFGYEGLQYHTSWDWLMPVVEKINKHITKFNLTSSCVIFRREDGTDIVVDRRSNNLSLIEATWQACVSFITWHNQKL